MASPTRALVDFLAETSAKNALEPSERLSDVFSIAHDAGTQRAQTNLVQQVRAGITDISQLSVRVSGAEASILAREVEETKARQNRNTTAFLVMLDQLNDLAGQIEALDRSIEESLDSLKDIYGDDPIQGMAEALLSEEERGRCENDEELMDAMVAKYLDENGNPRPGAENLDPRVLEVLGEWRERQEKVRAFEDINQEFEANGGELTPELESKAANFTKNATYAELSEAMDQSGDTKLADELADLDSLDQSKNASSGSFTL